MAYVLAVEAVSARISALASHTKLFSLALLELLVRLHRRLTVQSKLDIRACGYCSLNPKHLVPEPS